MAANGQPLPSAFASRGVRTCPKSAERTDLARQAANRFVTIPIATGIGEARNALIARAALALIAIGASYGTLSEIALGLQFGRPVLTLLEAPTLDGARPMGSADAALDSVCRLVLGLAA